MLIRPGQKSMLLPGHEDKSGEPLLGGIRIEAEPNVGTDNKIINLRLSAEGNGEHPITLSSGPTPPQRILMRSTFRAVAVGAHPSRRMHGSTMVSKKTTEPGTEERSPLPASSTRRGG